MKRKGKKCECYDVHFSGLSEYGMELDITPKVYGFCRKYNEEVDCNGNKNKCEYKERTLDKFLKNISSPSELCSMVFERIKGLA